MHWQETGPFLTQSLYNAHKYALVELFAHIIYNIGNLRRVGSTLNLHDVKWNPESVGVGKAF